MRLVVLHEGESGNVPFRVAALERSAKRAEIEFQALDSLKVAHHSLDALGPGDMLYNAGRGSSRLETLLIGPNVATFYADNPVLISDRHDSTAFSAVHDRVGLQAPKTVHRLAGTEKQLTEAVDVLGGFPVVLKLVGGTLGTGTMLIESMRSLRSIVDYVSNSGEEFILREFIEPSEVARLIVLGDKVIASNRKFVPEGDFRTSIRHRAIEPKSYNAEVTALAVAATECCGLEFGGVDLLIGVDGRLAVLELNFPHDFWETQRVAQIPISDMMVAHLAAKAERFIGAANIAQDDSL